MARPNKYKNQNRDDRRDASNPHNRNHDERQPYHNFNYGRVQKFNHEEGRGKYNHRADSRNSNRYNNNKQKRLRLDDDVQMTDSNENRRPKPFHVRGLVFADASQPIHEYRFGEIEWMLSVLKDAMTEHIEVLEERVKTLHQGLLNPEVMDWQTSKIDDCHGFTFDFNGAASAVRPNSTMTWSSTANNSNSLLNPHPSVFAPGPNTSGVQGGFQKIDSTINNESPLYGKGKSLFEDIS